MSCSENNGVIAKCSECNKNKLGSFKTIANFKLHFQRVHPKAYAQLENSNVPNEEIKKPTIKNTINKKGVNVSKEDVDAAIIRFTVQDMQPFSRTETAAFQNLIAVCLGYPNITEFPFKFMSERTVKRKIFNLYDEHVKDLEKTLSKQKWFSLTMDIWSCKNRSFFAVSIHYIDDKTFEQKSFLLTCQDFPSPHTHEHIAERLQMLYSQKKYFVRFSIPNCEMTNYKPYNCTSCNFDSILYMYVIVEMSLVTFESYRKHVNIH